FPPTVLAGVAPAHRVCHVPVPGPVLPVLTFRTPDEAVAMAGGGGYGPAAGGWSGDGSRALAVADRLRAGPVGANTAPRPGRAGRRVHRVRAGTAARVGGVPCGLRRPHRDPRRPGRTGCSSAGGSPPPGPAAPTGSAARPSRSPRARTSTTRSPPPGPRSPA